MSIEIDQFHFKYALGAQSALTGVQLTINPGEVVILCGASGSGKSTLLRCLKRGITPVGTVSGSITGLPPDREVAIVFQNPETQLTAATVINDLAFQMENLSIDPFTMKKRMSETVGFFGLEGILHQPAHTLSGGQKQMTALCAALMCEPALLLLDEPISQLDPLAGAAFLQTLKKINEELNITIIMAEHRLDDCAALADRVVYMDAGRVVWAGSTEAVFTALYHQGRPDYIPLLSQASLAIDGRIALTPRVFRANYPAVKAGKNPAAPFSADIHDPIFNGQSGENASSCHLSSFNITAAIKHGQENDGKQKCSAVFPETDAVELIQPPPHGSKRMAKNVLVKITDITVQYPDGEHPVLNRLNLTCLNDEFLCIAGGNGSGKSTLLQLIAGIIKPRAGRVKTNTKRLGYLPQQVRDYFLRDRIRDEIDWSGPDWVNEWCERLGLLPLLDKHPFDISGGEQQKAALLSILSRRPGLILLDEPTRAMDPPAQKILAGLLQKSSAAVIAVTHDLEFAALYASRCAMLFDGEIVFDAKPRTFFARSRYYTTAIHKGLRHIDESAVILPDALRLWELGT